MFVRSLSLHRHWWLTLLATRFLNVHEQSEKVICLNGDTLKAFIPLRYGVKGEADDRAVNTQFDRRVFHRVDVARWDELDVVVDVFSWFKHQHI